MALAMAVPQDQQCQPVEGLDLSEIEKSFGIHARPIALISALIP